MDDMRGAKAWRRRVARAAKWLALGTLGYAGANVAQVVAASRRDETRPADCAIVLGAAVWPGERPSGVLRARTERGGEVYHAGLVGHLILTGGLGDHPPAEAEMMRRILAARDVPAEAMLLETAATTTQESARFCARLMGERGWRTALLVSDPWHLPRATRLLREQGVTVYACPAFDSPSWRRPASRVRYTLREALGLAWQRLFAR